jgi:anthranilate phosphoribosyltransferase
MKTLGRFFNVIGPFLAAVPVSTQITGVSDHSVLPTFRQLAAEDPSKRFWLTWNELGADEMLSIEDSNVYDSGRDEEFVLRPREIGLGAGSFDDLLPVSDLDATVDNFMALIGGDGPPGAIESIRLNAAALAINCEVAADWPEGLQMASDAMDSGAPAALIERLRAHGEKASAASAPAPNVGA